MTDIAPPVAPPVAFRAATPRVVDEVAPRVAAPVAAPVESAVDHQLTIKAVSYKTTLCKHFVRSQGWCPHEDKCDL